MKVHERSPSGIFLFGIALFCIFLIFSFAFIIGTQFVFERIFHINSENAVTYFIRDNNDRIKVTNDLGLDQADRLVFMIDFNCVFNFLDEIEAILINDPIIELSWDEDGGEGIIKEFRPDGSKFLVVLSRYIKSTRIPDGFNVKGLFIGGDLPYGDVDVWKDRSRRNSGMAFYDGKRWYHIWCAANEGLGIGSMKESLNEDRFTIKVEPWNWDYLGSDVRHQNSSEVIVQSYHEIEGMTGDSTPVRLSMKRTLYKKAGDDYVILKIEYINMGKFPLVYSYAYGDEPWVGDFGDSAGDVGWADGALYKYQGNISSTNHTFAGLWDIGNDVIGEGHGFTGYANFIEWLGNPPDSVYFANDFTSAPQAIDSHMPLNSKAGRVVYLMWDDEILKPGEGKAYTLAIGLARPGRAEGFPLKPNVGVVNKLL